MATEGQLRRAFVYWEGRIGELDIRRKAEIMPRIRHQQRRNREARREAISAERNLAKVKRELASLPNSDASNIVQKRKNLEFAVRFLSQTLEGAKRELDNSSHMLGEHMSILASYRQQERKYRRKIEVIERLLKQMGKTP